MKDKILIEKHCLPDHLQQNLYGEPHHHNYDGIHLHGPDGRNHYTRSLCNILQTVMVAHSREPHRHVIPRVSPPLLSTPSLQSCISNMSSRSSKNTTTHPKPKKHDHALITIEPENTNNYEYNLYTIPTSNYFEVLGN